MIKTVNIDCDKSFIDTMNRFNISLHWREDNPRTLPARFVMDNTTTIEPYSGFFSGDALCTMGAFSYSHSKLQAGMVIGRYCAISWGLTVTGPRHPYEWLTTSNVIYDRFAGNIKKYLDSIEYTLKNRDPRVFEKAMPCIGNDVWIGQNVTLNRGIKIGDGAVIAAYSVVTKDVPPYSIVGGNPAQLIKYRFSDETIGRLIKIRWWDYLPHQFVNLDITNVEAFIDDFERLLPCLEKFEPKAATINDLLLGSI